MDFISNLYFNTFKKIGNLRFMFVISCVFSLWAIIFNLSNLSQYRDIYHDVYDNNTNIEYFDKHIELRYVWHPEQKSIFRNYSEKDMEQIKSFYIARMCKSAQYDRLLETVNSWWWDKGTHKDVRELCAANIKTDHVVIYSYIGILYRILAIVFCFYLPFLLLLLLKGVFIFPVKFIVDGYKHEKKNK